MIKSFSFHLLVLVTITALAVSLADSPSPVNLNSANQADLERIPGIGPAMASRIILERNRRGGFRTMEDLLKVRGIGRKTLAKLERYLFIDNTSLNSGRRFVSLQQSLTNP